MNEEINCINNKGEAAKKKLENDGSEFLFVLFLPFKSTQSNHVIV